MSKFQIVLADWEVEYVSRLGARFLERFGEAADIQLITDPAYFEDYFSRRRHIDWLILNEKFYSEQLKRQDIGGIIRLNERPPVLTGPASGHGKEDLLLYKYVSMKEIFTVLEPSLSLESQVRTRLICVYSPFGGAGTTTVALALAGALAQKRRNVLYLSTETIQSAAMLLPGEEKLSTEFYDVLLSGDPKMSGMLPEQCGHAGFDYLKPISQPIAIHGLAVRHFQRLAELLREAGRYDFVVMDCSSEFSQEKTRLMGSCDRVVIVTGQGQTAEWKTQALLRDINTQGEEKFVAVCNRYRADRSDRIKAILLEHLRVLSYIPELSQEACSSLERLAEEGEIAKLALHLL